MIEVPHMAATLNQYSCRYQRRQSSQALIVADSYWSYEQKNSTDFNSMGGQIRHAITLSENKWRHGYVITAAFQHPEKVKHQTIINNHDKLRSNCDKLWSAAIQISRHWVNFLPTHKISHEYNITCAVS